MRLLFSGFRKRDYNELSGSLRAKSQKTRTPHLKNSGKAELMEFVSSLVTFARRHQVMVVYPGTVKFAGKMANLVAFVVTKREIIGVNCFGYSGTIVVDENKWYQNMNDVRTEIEDPRILNREQADIVAPMLKDAGLAQIPFRVVSVFTSHSVTLRGVPEHQVFTGKEFINELKETVARETASISPEETARKINSYVVRLKSEKK